ncbi:MAG TPA: methionyl-tRNA formyltransferase [Clostridiales bacterium]|nr:methionyl-tRNA formyltransferase [Clostridiales bacterium]HPV02653.1 methionyl-tRNA formyltransferase [Clostridiales bacterium]
MRIVFMGTPDFAVPCLEALVRNGHDVAAVVTQPDKPVGRSQSVPKPPAVKEAAIRLGISNILQPEKIRTPEFAETLRRLEPDVIVTAAYGKILPKTILDIPRHGCINVHASLLPKYRGAAPIQWAIINGDSKTGVTTFFMDEGMDTGDIILMKETEIDPDMNAQELFDRLKVLGAEVLTETLEAIGNGTATRTPQDHSKATYVTMMTRETGLIDWSKSAAEIHNLVRGTDPWPGAYTFYRGKRLKIWKTAVCRDQDILSAADGRDARPGTLLRRLKQGLIVATGNGLLTIKELQFENARRMSVAECGHNMDEGEVFG